MKYPILEAFGIDPTQPIEPALAVSAWQAFFQTFRAAAGCHTWNERVSETTINGNYGGKAPKFRFVHYIPHIYGYEYNCAVLWVLEGYKIDVQPVTARIRYSRKRLLSYLDKLVKEGEGHLPSPFRSILLSGPPLPGRCQIQVGYTDFDYINGVEDPLTWDSEESMSAREYKATILQEFRPCFYDGRDTGIVMMVKPGEKGGCPFGGIQNRNPELLWNSEPRSIWGMTAPEARETLVGKAYLEALATIAGVPLDSVCPPPVYRVERKPD